MLRNLGVCKSGAVHVLVFQLTGKTDKSCVVKSTASALQAPQLYMPETVSSFSFDKSCHAQHCPIVFVADVKN